MKGPTEDDFGCLTLYLVIYTMVYTCHRRRRLKTEEKAIVVAVVWGTDLNAALTIFSNKDDLNKSFWENIPFGRVVVWYSVNKMVIYFFNASILPLFYSSFSSNSSSWKIFSAAKN